MARIWFVSDYLPFPPDNGVSLPLSNLLTGLQQVHDVSYLYLHDQVRRPGSPSLIADNRAAVDLYVVTVHRKPAINRAVDELMLRAPLFHGFDLDAMEMPREVADADVYLFSPFTALAAAGHQSFGSDALRVAWINDSITALLRSRANYLAKKGLGPRTRLHLLSQWLRSWYMGKLERQCLEPFDMIYVQTATEVAWIDRISGGTLTPRTRAVTNGVNQALFSRPIASGCRSVLFFGDMSGVYNDLVIWLLRNVWPLLLERVPDARFFLVGKNASATVLRMVEEEESVHYEPYVADIANVFAEKGVMLAPVFKDYGVINKVLESMAAGVPVVGDRTAYNGIAGFQPDRHGVVADTPAEMAAAVVRLFEDSELHHSIAEQARAMMQRGFSWQSRIDTLRRDIEKALLARQ